MIKKLNNYFKEKKINAIVKDTIHSDNFITFNIQLNDINKLNKFNKRMQEELSYILGTNATLKVGNVITITINSSILKEYKKQGININIGTDTLGNTINVSFIDNPHWLIGGATGSGKSVFLNNLIKQLINKYPNDVEFCFIDLKMVEFYKYNFVEHNLTKVANDLGSALKMLDDVIVAMNRRYEKYQANGCLSIQDYNKLQVDGHKDRYLFVVIDELAELMLQDKKNVQDKLQRLLQLGRASGIYVISATQRPSADVLSGTLKVNYTTRVCFKVGSIYDSKTIINQVGGEQLFGNGDGLIVLNGNSDIKRFQAYAPSDDSILERFKKQTPPKTSFLDRIKNLLRL